MSQYIKSLLFYLNKVPFQRNFNEVICSTICLEIKKPNTQNVPY